MTALGGVMLAASLLSPSSTADASDFVEPDYSFADDVGESDSGGWTDSDKAAYRDKLRDSYPEYDLPGTPGDALPDGATIHMEVYKVDERSPSCDAGTLVSESEKTEVKVGEVRLESEEFSSEGTYLSVIVIEDRQGNELYRAPCAIDSYQWEWSIDAASMSEGSASDDPPRSVYSNIGLALLAVGLPMALIPARRRTDDDDDDTASDLALTSTYMPAGISNEQEVLWASILDNIDECVRADIAEDDADLRSITEYLARIRREWEDLPSAAIEDHDSAESRAVTDSLRALAARSEEVVSRVYSERTRAVALTREVIAARYGDENFDGTTVFDRIIQK